MMKPHCLARTIQVRWFSRAARLAAAFLVVAVAMAAPPVQAPTVLAQWKTGVAAYQSKRYAEAIRILSATRTRLPKLADYTAYWLASAEYESGNLPQAVEYLAPVWRVTPHSPLAARAALLEARIYLDLKSPQQAMTSLKQHWSELPAAEGELALAESHAVAGDLVAAVVHYQVVYFRYPLSPEARPAEAALDRLRSSLGDTYPPAMGQAVLEREEALAEAGEYGRARRELESWIGQLGGPDRELARVRAGAAMYHEGDAAGAAQHLKELAPDEPEADAERLYYLAECARKLDREGDIDEALERLRKAHPNSPWRVKALVAAGNRRLIENQQTAYVALYRACYQARPSDPQAAYCHWKVAWQAYLTRNAEAGALLREHVTQYPESEKAGAALYFLGRQAEAEGDAGSAGAYWRTVVEHFPASYYKVLAAQRLAQTPAARGQAPATAARFLRGLKLPTPERTLDLVPDAATSARLERSRALASAGLEEWAEGELRFGARNGEKKQLLAMELARNAARRGDAPQGIRWIKALARDYLSIPPDPPHVAFLKLAFPLPYRTLLERYTREQKLDLHIVAGLIRQESEFEPKAISHAQAYGLTQVLPTVGRQISRELGIRRFQPEMLLRPEINLRFGTYYLKGKLDDYGGHWEQTLAAYNAGANRVKTWQEWGTYREPAEFIETIPFSETRNYVQVVLRNAAVYRELYGQEKHPAAAPARPAKKKSPAATPTRPTKKKRPAAATAKPAKKKRTSSHRKHTEQ
jgi:soluble lytic murein transglycosylase